MSSPKIKGGWLSTAKRVASPNYSDRPDIEDISLLVVHNISLPSGQFGQSYHGTSLIELFFCNRLVQGIDPYLDSILDMQVSAHLLIYRNGDIVQFVPFHKRAWHAGASSFDERLDCNDFSIGIEMEGDDITPFTHEQYVALTTASQAILLEYPAISANRITGHSDIAPERKTDPGPFFDWHLFFKLLDGS